MRKYTQPAKDLAKYLNLRHAELHSWRKVAAEYHSPLVKPGTLNRIAKSKGKYIPNDKSILAILGLLTEPELIPEWLKKIRSNIHTMAKDTKKSLTRLV